MDALELRLRSKGAERRKLLVRFVRTNDVSTALTTVFISDFFQKSHEDKVDAVLLKRFHHFDENNEGKVSKGELKKMLNAKGMKCDFFRPEPF